MSDAEYEERATMFGRTLHRDNRTDKELLDEALAVAAKSDVIVAALGESSEMSGESSCRTDLEMPDTQRALLQELLKTGKPVVLVLFTGRPLVLNWEQENVPAILNVWFGGSEAALAIGDVLFGNVNPSGKLTATFPKSVGQIPLFYNHKNTGRPLPQGAWFQKFRSNYLDVDNEPLYPFGYGLSYTGFAYDEMTVEDKPDEIQVKLSVTNTGHCEGDEVIQLYVHKMDSRVVRPIRTLKDFVRIKNVRPGETRKVTLCAKKQELRYYDVISGQMLLEDGGYLFEIGASSVDIRLMKKLILDGQKAGVRNPFALTEAIRYDDYTNCFIHKGTSGHAEHGETCLIPGRPGEAPDEIQKLPDGKVRGELVYRDFFFENRHRNSNLPPGF